MTNKLSGLLGMAKRAGHAFCGFDAAAELLQSGKAALILLAADLSPKTEKEIRFLRKGKAIPLLTVPLDKERMGQALGLRKPVGIFATDDTGFAAAMQQHIGHNLEEDGSL